MNVQDYLPDQLLLPKDFLTSSIDQEVQKKEKINKMEINKSGAITFIIAGISILSTLIAALPSISVIACSFLTVLFVILSLVAIIYGTRWYHTNNDLGSLQEEDLKEIVMSKVRQTIKHTAIIIIVYKEENDRKYSNDENMKFLTAEDTFLPHAEMEVDKTIEEQTEVIERELLSSYNINLHDILQIKAMDNRQLEFSIKPVHDKVEMNAFAFYLVKLNMREKGRLLNNVDAKWMTLKETRNDPRAMGVNKDIIDYLYEHKNNIPDSFTNFADNMRIIWNITKKCKFNCVICATHDEKREELSAADKIKVLNSILSASNCVASIDFAGGDPCCSEESISIIETAIQCLGGERVSVTTTGKGIGEISEDKRLKVLTQCEITIDASHDNLSEDESIFSREEMEYSKLNVAKIENHAENIRKLNINIPLLEGDLSDVEIERLVNRVVTLKENNPRIEIETSLLRLMPVGSFGKNQNREQYRRYNPLMVAKKIKNMFESKGIICKYHCSLRVLEGMDNCDRWCEMLEQKIGIDCAGNVFACAWGSYIAKYNTLEENPFYLGNLVETQLTDILNGKGEKTQAYRNIHKELENKTHRHFCSVVSAYMDDELFKNKDPLAARGDRSVEDVGTK
ncbi:MAG: SPASM domain-containing protein [Turicibacter sp.]|nr:SPASM domain-containing protein [Turicibacter sp.]